jgi:hypothetical protein
MSKTAAYLTLFDELRRKKRWSTDVTVLRFAALTLASTPLADPARQLESAAAALREHAPWYDPLRGGIRYAVAATILRRGRDPREVASAVEALRLAFRAARLPRGGVSNTMAALLIVLHGSPQEAPRRIAAILERWNADHPWLTGADDLPMAALHALRDEAPEQIAARVEWIYQRLRQAGYPRGNPLQLAAHLLAIDPRGEQQASTRFMECAEALRARRERISSSRFDEVALLALTSRPSREVVTQVIEWRDELRAVRPKPGSEIVFSIASGLLLAAEAERIAALSDTADVATLRALQAILEAQQAAMAASAAVISAAAASAAT